MLAVLLALAAAVSYSGSDYAAGLAARGASVVRVTVIAQVTNAALVMPVVPLVSSQMPSLPSMAWAAAAGVSGVAGTMALYLGFRHAAFSVASPVSAVCSAAFSVLAGLLFGERPGPLSLAGIALALPAIAAVSATAGEASTGLPGGGEASLADAGSPGARNPRTGLPFGGEPSRADAAAPGEPSMADAAALGEPSMTDAAAPGARNRGRPRRSATGRHAAGVGWGLIAGAAIGLFFIGLNRAGKGIGLWPLAVAELSAVVAVFCMAAVTGQLKLPPAGTRWLSVLTGITAAAGTLSYFLATHRGLLAITAVITSLYPAGTILLARVLLAERLTAVRLTGLCLAAASVCLIAVAGAG